MTQPPAPGVEPTWHYMIGEQKFGPVPAGTLLSMIQTGAVHAATMVWREGMTAWVPAGGTPEFAMACAAAPNQRKKESALGLTQTGLIVFIVLLVCCVPLCWLPWVIKDLRAQP